MFVYIPPRNCSTFFDKQNICNFLTIVSVSTLLEHLELQRNWVFATNSNFLIHLSLQPDVVNLCYFKLRSPKMGCKYICIKLRVFVNKSHVQNLLIFKWKILLLLRHWGSKYVAVHRLWHWRTCSIKLKKLTLGLMLTLQARNCFAIINSSFRS